jgi:diaminopimelate epimerase
MALRFAKYEAVGNDFIVVDADAPPTPLSPADAVRLCDRHRGIGADGVLIVGGSKDHPTMRVINSDGSIAEMCGNGIRCVALHLEGRHGAETLDIATDAGAHHCEVHRNAASGSAVVEVTMRVPKWEPNEIPVRAKAPLVDVPFDVDGNLIRLSALSLGNPHAVTFDDLRDGRYMIGPRIERDPRFPSGVNVGFARLTERGAVELHVWERGAGWTQACGTGACAAAVAAVETGRVERGQWVKVLLPGGTVEVWVGGHEEPVRMRGPARHVFDGVIGLDTLRSSTASAT